MATLNITLQLETTSVPEHVTSSNAFIALSTISSFLSICGSLAIIITYFLWRDIQSTSRKILVCISICDFLTASGNVMTILRPHLSKSDELCVGQSFVTTTSTLCSFFWTSYLGLYLFLSFSRRHFRVAKNLMLVFHITAWGIPLSIGITALVNKKLGYSQDFLTGGWCWIDSGAKNSMFWMVITGKAWEVATYVLITVFFTAVKCRIKKEIQQHLFITRRCLVAATKADRRLSFVPLVFIFIRIWGNIRFLLFAFVPDFVSNDTWQKRLQFLVYLHGIGDNAQGFANFLLYCFLTERFQNLFKTICCTRCWHKTLTKAKLDNCEKGASINVQTSSETSPLIADKTRNEGTLTINAKPNIKNEKTIVDAS